MGIKRKFKEFCRKILYGPKATSETYVRHLKKIGMSIGERVYVFDPRFTLIDETRPWMVKIGDDVQITRGVTVLTHGYDWSVLKGKYGVVLGSAGAVEIGNNVFIGMNTTILKGVHIGNNVIIGANSLVNKNIPDDCVVAGNPARIVCTLEEYLKKRISLQEKEAMELVKCYREAYDLDPTEAAMSEFFWLWSGAEDIDSLHESYVDKMYLLNNYKKTREELIKNCKKYSTLCSFLEENQ